MIDIFKIVKDNDFISLRNNLKYIKINTKDLYNNSLLHYAVINKNLDITRFLLLNKIDINDTNNDNNTALHLSILNDSIAIFKTLIKANALIDVLNNDGESPLMLAIKLNREEMIQILMSLHANINYVNIRGESAIFFSIYSNKLSLFNSLILENKDLLFSKTKNNDTLLHVATRQMNSSFVKRLVELNILPNNLNCDLETPLFNCARNCDYDSARILIENGAFIEFKNKFNESILDISNQRFKDFLISYVNKSFYLDYKRRYPLIFSIITYDYNLFLERLSKFEVNKKDDHNLNAYDYAKLYNRQIFIKKLEELLKQKIR